MESRSSDSPSITPDCTPSTTRAPRRLRLWASFVLAGCAVLLGLAAYLTPNPAGHGTHRQLGFGKCGMLVTTGLPCPTCDMTTAFAYTVRGRLISAFLAQPTGLLLALATIAVGFSSVWVLLTGRLPRVRIPVITPYRLFFGLLVLLLGGWAFKIIVGLLTGTLPDHA